MRILPEISQALIELKRKYPNWGIAYLRTRWIQMGNQSIAKSTIYKIFKRCPDPHDQRLRFCPLSTLRNDAPGTIIPDGH